MTQPTGSISIVQELLRTTLAASPTFRAWVGAPSADDAALRIYHDALPEFDRSEGADPVLKQLQDLRPYAIVWTEALPHQRGFRYVLDSAPGGFATGGRLMLYLNQDVPAAIAANPAEVDLQFRNVVGGILDDLCELAWAQEGGYLAIDAMAIVQGPERAEPEDHHELGDHQGVWIEILWGNLP